MKNNILFFVLFISIIIQPNHSYAQGVWIKKNDFPSSGRTNAISFVINDTAFVGLGIDSLSNPFSDLKQYDEIHDIWIQKQNLTDTTWYPNSFQIGNYGYVITNHNHHFWQYSLNMNNWVQKANTLDSNDNNIYGSVAASSGNYGFFGYGSDMFSSPIKCFNNYFRYNCNTNSWLIKSIINSSSCREQSVSFSINGKIYVGLGGFSGSNQLYEYDTLLDMWSNKTNLPAPRRSAAVSFVINNKAYIGLGFDSINHFLNDFWEYNPATDSWKQMTSFAGAARALATSFVVNEKGYIACGTNYNGFNNGRYFNDLWQFDPNASGINEIKEEPKLNVYPNPTSSIVNIQLTAGSINTIEITNVVGQIVHCKMVNDNSTTNCKLNTENLSQGIYFIKATDEKGFVHTTKFVKE